MTQLVTEALKHPAIQTVEDFEEKVGKCIAMIRVKPSNFLTSLPDLLIIFYESVKIFAHSIRQSCWSITFLTLTAQ